MKRLFAMLASLLFSIGAASLGAAPSVDGVVSPGEYAASTALQDGAVTVSWSIEGASIALAVSARTTGWVSLGFGAARMMEDADMILGYASPGAPGRVLDCHSTGPTGPHPTDESLGGKPDLAAAAAAEKDGVTTMEFRRPLAASEATDKPIAAGDRFLWAIGSEDDPDSYHQAAGTGVLDGGAAPSGTGSAARLLHVLPHALPLVLSLLLMTSGMLVARYGKKNKRWLSIHKPLGGAAGILALAGLGLGIRMVALGSGIHLRVPHTWIGIVALAASAAAPLLGQAMFRVKKGKAEIRRAHRWTGRAAILLMALTILSGLLQAGILG